MGKLINTWMILHQLVLKKKVHMKKDVMLVQTNEKHFEVLVILLEKHLMDLMHHRKNLWKLKRTVSYVKNQKKLYEYDDVSRLIYKTKMIFFFKSDTVDNIDFLKKLCKARCV